MNQGSKTTNFQKSSNQLINLTEARDSRKKEKRIKTLSNDFDVKAYHTDFYLNHLISPLHSKKELLIEQNSRLDSQKNKKREQIIEELESQWNMLKKHHNLNSKGRYKFLSLSPKKKHFEIASQQERRQESSERKFFVNKKRIKNININSIPKTAPQTKINLFEGTNPYAISNVNSKVKIELSRKENCLIFNKKLIQSYGIENKKWPQNNERKPINSPKSAEKTNSYARKTFENNVFKNKVKNIRNKDYSKEGFKNNASFASCSVPNKTLVNQAKKTEETDYIDDCFLKFPKKLLTSFTNDESYINKFKGNTKLEKENYSEDIEEHILDNSCKDDFEVCIRKLPIFEIKQNLFFSIQNKHGDENHFF